MHVSANKQTGINKKILFCYVCYDQYHSVYTSTWVTSEHPGQIELIRNDTESVHLYSVSVIL